MASGRSRHRRRDQRLRQPRDPRRVVPKFSQTICLEIVGIAEVVIGFFSIVIEAISFRFPQLYQRFATGIFSGIVSIACGCITICLAIHNSPRWVLTTCLLHFVALIAVVTGISCVMREESQLAIHTAANNTIALAQKNFMEWKNRMVLTMNEVQFVVSVLLTIYLLLTNLRRHFAQRAGRSRRRGRSSLSNITALHHNSIDLFAFSPPTYSSLVLQDLQNLQEPPPPYEDPPPFTDTDDRLEPEGLP